MTDIYRNYSDIFNPDDWVLPIHLVGLGSIGSNLFYLLSRRGIEEEIHLWDGDKVELHNIPTQGIYRPSDVGMYKVDAAAAYAERQEVETPIVVHPEPVVYDTELSGVVISGVDSMASRDEIFNAVIASTPEVELYIDGRVGGESYQVHTLNPSIPDERTNYNDWLFDDSEAAELPCGEKVILDSPIGLASVIGVILTRFSRGEAVKPMINVRLGGVVRAR